MRGAWVYVVVIATVCIAGAYIAHLRLSEIPDPAIGHSDRPPSLGRPVEKVIEYRLDGPAGAPVSASYLDTEGSAREVSGTLPWRLTLHTRRLTVSTGVIAQAKVGPVSCRITVDGRVRDENHADAPDVACNVLGA